MLNCSDFQGFECEANKQYPCSAKVLQSTEFQFLVQHLPRHGAFHVTRP